MAKRTSPVEQLIEVMISFDTTGSMYPCLALVRQRVEEIVNRLYGEIPNIRIGILAHGDYCDKETTYVTKMLDLTNNRQKVISFIRNVEKTYGGDAPECYELVMHEARGATWTAGAVKIFVMIGDDVPHGKNETQNFMHLDWRNEFKLLREADVYVYAVQALGRSHATPFYREIGEKLGCFHLKLEQFNAIEKLIFAVCFKQQGDEQLQQYEQEVQDSGGMDRGVVRIFDTLLDRAPAPSPAPDLNAVHPSRFQLLDVTREQKISDFVRANDLEFKKGRGFYQFTKPELVQENKEVVLRNKTTGDMFSGDKAREMIGLAVGERKKIKPTEIEGFDIFIQSNSWNRNLEAGTKFLYEVSDWSE